MSITPTEAADALRDIDQSATHSRQLKGYRHAAPYFFMWGLIWIVGYTATGISPSNAWLWVPLAIGGMIGSFVTGRFQARLKANRASPLRVGLTWAVVIAFYVAVLVVMQPHELNQYGAFPALLASMIYAVIGVWFLPRWLWLGIGIFAATLAGYYLLAPWFSFWMAAVGGGGLFLTGFWMRKV